MAKRLVIDGETRSTVDLKKVGAPRYAEHPSTDMWCVAYAIDDQPVQLWLPGEPLPADLLAAIADSECTIIAHNATFERGIWHHVLAPRHGWPELPPLERWSCTQARALALALPPKLGQLAEALSLTHQKADDGIMHLMAKQRRPRGDENPADGPFWFDDPEHLAQLCDYCKADVECEREADRWLSELIPSERQLWCLDQTINDRGPYTDGALIDKAIAIATAADRAVQAELQQITDGTVESTNCRDKLLAWLAAHGCEVADCEKETLRRALTREGLTPEVRRVIELRQEAAHASAGKFQALHNWRGIDGRVRGSLRFHGAATGRWSGSGPQFQNLRKEVEGTAAKLEAVMSGDIEVVRALGPPIEMVGDVARCAVGAPPGSRLLVGDFSGIESRMLAWIAGEQSKLAQWEKFDRTQDPADHPYVSIAASMGFTGEDAYDRGKRADLSFGFMGSRGAYQNYAPKGDTTTATDEQILAYRDAWRARHPRTKQFWYGIDRAAITAIQRAGQEIDCGRFTLCCENLHGAPFLFITLPGGRRLSYPFVKLITNDRGYPAVTFMDNAQIVGGWAEVRKGRGAWPGLWAENLTQAVARDLLAAAMVRLEAAGYPVVLHVHDEIVCELPTGEGSLEEFKYLIERLPGWAAGMPVAAKVRNGPRFAEVAVAVEHVPGSLAAVAQASRKPAKRKALVIPASLQDAPAAAVGPSRPTLALADVRLDSDNPRARAIAWAIERENIRQRKEAGAPPPWTADPILAAGRFCNTYREHDAVTRWVTANIVEPHRENPDLWFALLAARCCSNEPAALAKLVQYLLPFDAAGFRTGLAALLARGTKVYRTDAYKPIMPPRELKGITMPEFHTEYVLMPAWREREHYRPQPGNTLAAHCERLQGVYRVGDFLAAQIIADLKHAEPLRSASDWWTFTAPGPGSRRGLNRVLGRPIATQWNEAHWHHELMRLKAEADPIFAAAGMAPVDAQNYQNICCEFDKWERARDSGKVTRKYKHAAEPLPGDTTAKTPSEVANTSIAEPTTGESEPAPADDASRVAQPAESGAAEPGPAVVSDGAEPGAGISFMITAAQKAALRGLGHTDEAIREMTPAAAHELLRQAEVALAHIVAENPTAATTAAPVSDGVETVPDYILADAAGTAQGTGSSSNGTGGASDEARAEGSAGDRGSKHATEQDTHSQDHSGKPFDDTWLLRKGYVFARAFPYTLPDGTLLYEQRRYELNPDIPAIKGRPRKRFLIRRQVNGAWVFGTGPRRIPYNWPALMRTGPGVNVFVPEGEGKVDALTTTGLLATTVVSHDWKPECVAALTGCDLFVLADHDDPALPERDKDGKILAEAARKALAPVAASVRVVPYQHLWEHLPAETRGDAPTPHEDIKNWLEERKGDAAKLLDICRKIPVEGEAWRRAPIASWAGKQVPDQKYTVQDRIPARQVFLFSGEGGDGKSNMIGHLCAAHVIAREWLGCVPQQGPAIYAECEDDENVLWRRLAAVAAYYNVPIETFARDLHLFSLIEHDTILAATSKRGIVEPTAAYQRLYEMAGDIKPVQIGLASVANTFAGNENVRTEVQQFIKLLARIPAVTGGSLALVSHPSLTGLQSTAASHQGLSGNTQWHNAVRARAATKRIKPKDEDGNGDIDTGLRTITFHKNQYGPPVVSLTVRWQNGLYVPITSTIKSGPERAAAAEAMTLALLRRFTEQNRTVSINPNPANYAPTQFAQTVEAEAAGLTAKDFKQAIERLLQRGEIEHQEFKKGSETRYRLMLKEEKQP
jgi:DNA polymerase